MSNLFIESQGRIVIVAHNSVPYNRQEWESILVLLRRTDLDSLRLLAYDDGGGGSVDSRMRQEALDAMGGRMPRLAVITGCRATRGITTAVGWFKPGVRAFAPDQFEKAAKHLDMSEDERAYASRTAPRLIAQLARKSA